MISEVNVVNYFFGGGYDLKSTGHVRLRITVNKCNLQI